MSRKPAHFVTEMFGLIPLLAVFAESRKFESLVDKYKEQLKDSSSTEKEEQAILWSLAELARQVDKTVTAEEVESEIGSKIQDILERVEIADGILRKDFAEMRYEFAITKKSITELVEDSKAKIIQDMEQFKNELVDNLQQLVETSNEAQQGWVQNSYENVRKTFSGIKTSSLTRSVIFFVCFQVLLAFGLIFYKKLDKQLRMLLF